MFNQKDVLSLYLDGTAPTRLEIKDSLKKATVKGNELNGLYAFYQRKIATGNQQKIANFIQQHPNSYVSVDALFLLIALQNTGTYEITDPDAIDKLFTGLSEELRCTHAGKNISARIEAARNTQIGSRAPDFSAPDVSGNVVRLSDFKGKYVLLDFWASWCVPCRTENPTLVKLYNKYKEDNFTILGYSTDSKQVNGKML